MRRQQIDAFPAMTAAMLRGEVRHGMSLGINVNSRRVVPLSNVADRRIVDCNESGEWSVFDSDEFGFRNPRNVWNGPPLDAVLLGDSFVSGSCVGEGQDMTSTIRSRVPATVGVAVGGFGPLMALAALREYVSPYRPKVVIWFYYEGNDLQDLLMETQDSTLRKYLDDPAFSQGLITHREEIQAQLREFLSALLSQAGRNADSVREPLEPIMWLKMTVKLYRVRTTLGLADWGSGCCDVVRYDQIIARAQDTVGRWKGRLMFVYLPSWRGLALPPWLRGEAALRARGDVLQAVAGRGIPIVDAHALLRESGSFHTHFAGPGLHFNAAGYARVAKAIVDSLPAVLRIAQ
jgi:hypothetical protein